MLIDKLLEFHHPLLLDQIKPRVQRLALPLSEDAGKALDKLKGFRDLSISLTESSEILFLPIETLFFLKGDPVRHLQSSRRTFCLSLIRMNQQFRLGFDRLEFACLAFEVSPGSDKATNRRSPTCISATCISR